MDEQKRNKVVLAVLAVVALGAGYWFLAPSSGGTQTTAVTEGSVVRKEKVAKEEAKTARKAKDPKAATRAEPTTIERKEREAPEATTVERKKKREEKTKEKKKTIAPAA